MRVHIHPNESTYKHTYTHIYPYMHAYKIILYLLTNTKYTFTHTTITGVFDSGGGGGSSYANPSYTITTNSQGVQSGNGVLYITLACQAGYYLSDSFCLACASNTYSLQGASACFSSCPSGSSVSSGAACACSQAGYYASSGSCVVCAAGSVTNTLASAGATLCTPCSAGKYSSSSIQACQSCAAGSVTDTLAAAGASTCTGTVS